MASSTSCDSIFLIANQLASNVEDGCGRGTAEANVAIRASETFLTSLRCRSLISEMDAGRDIWVYGGSFWVEFVAYSLSLPIRLSS